MSLSQALNQFAQNLGRYPLVCAESAEANGATHANMAPVAIIATDVEIIVLTLIINAIH